MTILKKSIDQTYTQGTPGVPATPGSPARKAYTSYEPGWGWSYTQVAVAAPPGWWQVNYSSGSFVDYIFDALTYDDLGNAATGTWYRVQATCEPISVPVYYPATAAVAPTPGIPSTAASFVTDYRIGWNAGARSLKAIGGDGRFAFKAPASSRGVVVGLNEADTGTSIAEIDHAFYIYAGKYKVVEQGLDRTAFALFADGGEFSIQRRGGSVSYYFGEAQVYSSAAASASDLMADCSLYYGGDSVIDASIGADLYGTSFAHAGLRPVASYAYAGAGQVVDDPALSGAGVSLSHMLALGSDKAYAASSASLSCPRTAGHGSISRFEANVALSALSAEASGHEAARSDTLLPALTALGSNKKYAAAGAVLQALEALGESSGLNPTYAISRGCLAFAQADAHGLTGGVGQGAVLLSPLQALAADHAYGDARTSFALISASAGIRIAKDGVFAGRFGKYAIKASATEREPNKLAATLAYSFEATAGASAQLALPKYSAAATGEGVVVGRALLAAPAFSLAASGATGAVGAAALSLSGKMAANGYAGAVLSVTIGGRFSLTTSGMQGGIGRSTMTLPLYELVACATDMRFGRAQLAMPALCLLPSGLAYAVAPGFRLAALGSAVAAAGYRSYQTYAVNLAGRQVTRYSNFPFFKIIRHAGNYYGVAGDGLYLLDGDRDNGERIRWNLKTGFGDFKSSRKKRLNGAFFNGAMNPGATAMATDDSGRQYAQELQPAGARSRRARFGKGAGSRQYAIGLSGSGAMTLDSIDFDVDILERTI